MSRHHELKLREEFWDAVMSGEKCFEVRMNDRGYQKGDTVSFIKVEECGIHLPCQSNLFDITYVLSGWGAKEGYVVFGIRRKDGEQDERLQGMRE